MSHEIICGDNLKIDIERVDCIFSDPPYNCTNLAFEGIGYEWVNKYRNILKEGGYFIIFGALEQYRYYIDAGLDYRFSFVWIKEKGRLNFSSVKKPMNQHEYIFVFSKGTKDLVYNKVYKEGEPYTNVKRRGSYKRGGTDQLDRSNSQGWTIDGYKCINEGKREVTTVLYGCSKSALPRKERTSHPTQKPINICMNIIEMLTNSGDLIIDPFCGSGSISVAAKLTGRDSIGIDINEDYCKIARERLAAIWI